MEKSKPKIEEPPKTAKLDMTFYGHELLMVGNETDTAESLQHYAVLTKEYMKKLIARSERTPQECKLMAKQTLGVNDCCGIRCMKA